MTNNPALTPISPLPTPAAQAHYLRAPDTLEQAIAAVATGSDGALSQLYDATVSRVYALALRITLRPESAEEVVEDVYVQVWREAKRFDPERGRPLAWLLTICRSRALDFLRRADEAESHPDPEVLRATDDSSAADDPLDLLLATEAQTAIHRALSKLTAVQRQLIALAFFRGYTHEDIAGYMSMPLGTVKTHIRNGLKTLKANLEAGLMEGGR